MSDNSVTQAFDAAGLEEQEYLVTREMTVFAKSPRDAALVALDAMENDADLPVLEVKQITTGEITIVDMEDIEDEAPGITGGRTFG